MGDYAIVNQFMHFSHFEKEINLTSLNLCLTQ